MTKIKSFQEIQGFLSVGYIYLIVMGILNETLYYNQIGIEFLNYSSILDVLISPISRLTSSISRLVIFIVIIFFAFKLPNILAKNKDKKWFKKILKFEPELTKNEIKHSLLKTFMFIVSLGLFGFYVGSGLGNGYRMSEKIEKGEIEFNDQIKFINGDESNVEIVGTNSTYMFYLEKDKKTVQITPISGIIQSIVKNK
ncbi:hypothetical protein SAMN05444483_12314 [Salegentibacter echinorum]|uniref:Uncharacterized protein n=1 Tax=Salegentibacter echinorum TaxID=1073325 RepID=A0A1M5M068_SALEC|nr:hypothetical protein [Salegentibacter echinorum]SHG70073.1 hypothetical protein SAMN05444483_12314 [Salegentibacter echinorum]